MSKRIIVMSLLVTAAIVLFSSYSDGKPRLDQAAVQEGERIYMQQCASCHGQTGKGEGAQQGTAINNQQFLSTVSDRDVFNMIKYGRVEAEMPEYGPVLSDEEMNKLTAFIRSWQTKPLKLAAPSSLDGNPDNGKALYKLYCLSCHGEQGKGKPKMGTVLAHPNHLKYLTDEQIWIAAAYGRDETRMGPSLEGLEGVRQLKKQDITDIVSYIRSLEDKPDL